MTIAHGRVSDKKTDQKGCLLGNWVAWVESRRESSCGNVIEIIVYFCISSFF